MPVRFVRCPAAGSKASENLRKSVINPISVSKLNKSMSSSERLTFASAIHSSEARVWAWKVTSAGKNVGKFEDLNIGDLAFFYTEKVFRYYAPIVFKWQSDILEDIVGWHKEDTAQYSLAFALGEFKTCNLSSRDYCTLLGYGRIPMHSDIHDAETSQELFEYIALPDQNLPGGHEFKSEGGVIYRIQQIRERSDGNRLHVLEKRGYVCEICKFDFGKYYGQDFKPSAHVHHLNPLALGKRRATSINEFVVLCAPCHTATHMGLDRRLHPWTPEELRCKVAGHQR